MSFEHYGSSFLSLVQKRLGTADLAYRVNRSNKLKILLRVCRVRVSVPKLTLTILTF